MKIPGIIIAAYLIIWSYVITYHVLRLIGAMLEKRRKDKKQRDSEGESNDK